MEYFDKSGIYYDQFSTPLEVSRWECISESHVRWDKQADWNVQRAFNYKHSEWVAAGSPLKMEEEAEPCAN